MNDERDKLWELLGRAKKPVVSPFFAANVLRAIRQSQDRPTILEWLRQQWRLSAATVTAVLVIGLTLNHWHESAQKAATDQQAAQEVATNADYEVITNLDELVAYQENSIWIDGSAE